VDFLSSFQGESLIDICFLFFILYLAFTNDLFVGIVLFVFKFSFKKTGNCFLIYVKPASKTVDLFFVYVKSD